MTSNGLENAEPCSDSKLLVISKGFELTVLKFDSGIVEYRVGRHSSRIAKGREGGFGVAIALLVQCAWDRLNGEWTWGTTRGVFLVISFLFLYMRFTEVQHESILALPSIGLQLETHRGLRLFGHHVLSTGVSREFLPIAAVSDVIINEGLCGWNIRRYLAVLSAGESRLRVVFQALDPPFPILKEVYHGIRETLFEEWDDGDEREVVPSADDNQG
ncbi:GPI-GlcNAc transferase complex, PIG-H component [Rhizoctonia solani AG-3 Rhs1AP]|uniref:GPI-GlcNAc transferase complex, PIG-H component n=1 Tax=Rhizoctonia solani AG-3 Rhs1AP TaxID=1086054 RepID=X8JV95_9AGAM|nr:GPI-GlcNAc transferase complex, PIG-H component [Rhizoctonia solani AG-3 Rhs1AP]